MLIACACLTPSRALAQDPFTIRAAILSAEDRRAPTPRDLATIRSGMRSGDPQTARVAVRALGRLERPELIPDIVPSLRHGLPEVRAEAANAIAQAAQALKKPPAVEPPPRRPSRGAARDRRPARGESLEAAIVPIVARLKVETDPTVRAALCESLGRLPFSTADEAGRAEHELLAALDRDASIDGRLGVALGLDSLARDTRAVAPTSDNAAAISAASAASIRLSDDAVAALRSLAALKPSEATTAARVRRLALDALTTAGAIDPETIRAAAADPDAQVRRLAAKGAGTGDMDATRRTVLTTAVHDGSPLVRYEALRAFAAIPADGGCAAGIAAIADGDAHVALLAVDTLGVCGWSTHAVELLDEAAHEPLESPRGWHRPAHALVALSTAAPAHAADLLGRFSSSTVNWVRMYAARAAANLEDRATLQRLASDTDDNVREAAVAGLRKVAGHDADEIYLAQLGRPDQQLVRSAAIALSGTPRRDAAVPALQATLQRLNVEGRDTTRDARTALAETLRDLGVMAELPRAVEDLRPASAIAADALRALMGARARITMRGVGTFDLALITTEAPASVIRFADLARRGYYNGLTFHRVVPDFVIQGGSPGANEYAGDAAYMRDEVGLWPHVRGAVGVSTRGHDTGDAQIFVDLVDNPRLNHVYTVFAQVLNGMNVVDQILEGDVMERVEILAGS